MSASGRGSGFHQFSGLSTPVLMFFESYYKPGTVTLGFQSIIRSEIWNEDKTSLTLKYASSGKSPILLVCLSEKEKYAFFADGKALEYRQLTNGAYEVKIPQGEHELVAKHV